MAHKYGCNEPFTWQGEQIQVFEQQDCYPKWHRQITKIDATGKSYTYWHRDSPTPYCGKKLVEMREFLILLNSWPMDIKGRLDYEYYGDAYDREHIRGLIRVVDIHDYFADGAAIIIPGDGMFIQSLPPPPPNTKYVVEDMLRDHGQENIFWGVPKIE
ncbi:hypothetical protein [Hymenobacter radiodurans]|uniref:hypothetical protein n=1 Tax=Hymenobacter radiodurans TaxID=2496028 RepID=UPI00105918EF|nr:hypothetical protein [Hymenobacter radiodurans]